MNDKANNIIIFNGMALIINILIFMFINFSIFICIAMANFGIEFKFLMLGFLVVAIQLFLNVKAIKQANSIKEEAKN